MINIFLNSIIFLASILGTSGAEPPVSIYAGLLSLDCSIGQGVYLRFKTNPDVPITVVFNMGNRDKEIYHPVAGKDGKKDFWFNGLSDKEIDFISWQANSPINLEVGRCMDNDDPIVTGEQIQNSTLYLPRVQNSPDAAVFLGCLPGQEAVVSWWVNGPGIIGSVWFLHPIEGGVARAVPKALLAPQGNSILFWSMKPSALYSIHQVTWGMSGGSSAWAIDAKCIPFRPGE